MGISGQHFRDGRRDLFDRLRTSSPRVAFNSELLFDEDPLFWDDRQVSGSGTSSVWNGPNDPSVTLAVSSLAGKRVRQTFQSFEGRRILMDAALRDAQAGITKLVGLFGRRAEADNGLFFKSASSGLSVVVRSKVSGAVIDIEIPRFAPSGLLSWNHDKLDGKGASGISLDFSKAHTFVIDFEWLSSGVALFGLIVNGRCIYCHAFHFADAEGAYTSTPNLPVRYEIENDGTGLASSLKCLSSSVENEEGLLKPSVPRFASTGEDGVDAEDEGKVYALVGARVRADSEGSIVRIAGLSAMLDAPAPGDRRFEWILKLNPTVSGTFAFADLAGSSMQIARGSSSNEATGGIDIGGGYGSLIISEKDTASARRMGFSIDGTPDEIVLCSRPLLNNATIFGSLSLEE